MYKGLEHLQVLEPLGECNQFPVVLIAIHVSNAGYDGLLICPVIHLYLLISFVCFSQHSFKSIIFLLQPSKYQNHRHAFATHSLAIYLYMQYELSFLGNYSLVKLILKIQVSDFGRGIFAVSNFLYSMLLKSKHTFQLLEVATFKGARRNTSG